jgi:hypothetical protein
VRASRPASLERVVLDSSVLLGAYRGPLIAAAALGYYTGFWGSWIVAEFARKRTEWIAERASRDGCDRQETRRRLRESRRRVNAFIRSCAPILRSVDYADVPTDNLDWLRDPDDWPVMLTALAADADVLVTDNSTDFPLGELANGILILGSRAFLTDLFARHPDAEASVRAFLASRSPG